MKKTVCLSNVVNSLGFSRCVFLFSLLILPIFSELRADDWGPYLGPSFPEEINRFEPTNAENDAENNYMPETLSKPRSAKPLPSGRKSFQSASRQAAFNSTLEPGEMIVPQGFYDDEPTPDASDTPAAPTTLKKKRKAIETATGLYDAEANRAAPNQDGGVPLNHGEILVDEFSFENSDYSNLGTNGLYNEMSPAMAGNYSGPLMMKPFGTGIMDNLTVFGGVSGFRNAVDAGRNGNFGFSEGVNWAGPATPQCTVSAQLGFRAIQSNINGSGDISDKRSRNQYFVTAGLFKRDLSFPVQGGVAFDWLDDDFYGKVKVRQFRCELSARTFSNLEYGFLGGFGVSKKGNAFINRREDPTGLSHYGVEAQNYYLLFLRKHFSAGGVAEFRGGLTERGDTILSAFAEFPLNDRLAFHGGFTTMIPEEGRGRNGYRRESWDVSVGFVFYFRGGACSKPCNPCRPMFNVADNGSYFSRIVRR